jgi:glutamate racemase
MDKIKIAVPAGVTVLSQGEIVADSLVEYLKKHTEMEEKCTKNGQIEFFTTDSTDDFDKHAAIFYGKPVKSRHIGL